MSRGYQATFVGHFQSVDLTLVYVVLEHAKVLKSTVPCLN